MSDKNPKTTDEQPDNQNKPANTDNSNAKPNYPIPDTFSCVVCDSVDSRNIIRKSKK